MNDLPRTAVFAVLVLVAASFALGFVVHGFLTPVFVDSALVQTVFSPGQSEPVLVHLIGSAESNVDVMLYQFSFSPLQDALIQAQKRGVQVRLILDPKIEANLYTAEKLALAGVDVRWASPVFASTHAKFLLTDGHSVFVGSTNWSRHAMALNREAAVLIRNAKIAASFQSVFESDWSLAIPWSP